MEKIKVDLLTICDYATISQDNKLSIMGIFDQIFVANLPANHAQFYIVGTLSGSAGNSSELTLSIKTPSENDAIPLQKLNITFGPNGKSNVVAAIGNMPVNESGFYKVVIRSGTDTVGEKQFGIFKAGTVDNDKTSEKFIN